MSKYLDVANGNLMYLLAAAVILFVLVQSVVFLIAAWKRGVDIGIDKRKMLEAVKSSAVFSIVPSLPIIISLIALSPILGMPFSWLRLSIVGSASYELIAAEIGAKSMGVGKLGSEGYTAQVFSNSMWVMSIGIIWGLLMCILFLKKYLSKISKVHTTDSKWAEIMVNALFFGMLSVFLGRPVVAGGIQLLVLVSSAAIMLIITYLGKKLRQQWIHDFSLAISMIAGMALAILFKSWI